MPTRGSQMCQTGLAPPECWEWVSPLAAFVAPSQHQSPVKHNTCHVRLVVMHIQVWVTAEASGNTCQLPRSELNALKACDAHLQKTVVHATWQANVVYMDCTKKAVELY